MRVLLALSLVVAASANAAEFSGAVLRVLDGDCVIVQAFDDKCECASRRCCVWNQAAFGMESRQSLDQICGKKTARVSWMELDRNGRTLGRVWYGECRTGTPRVRLGVDRYVSDRALYQLQHAARTQRLGLWSDATSIPP